MFIRRNIITLIAVVSTAMSVYASDLNIYPVNALFMGFNINNPQYKSMFDQNKAVLLSQYKNEFGKNFSNSVDKIDDCARYNTFAAYITVPRASRYEPDTLRKQGTLKDIYCPVTMNIHLVNLLSGETLYSNSMTQPAKLTFDVDASEEFKNKELVNQYKESTQGLITNLLSESAKSINGNIQTITTKVLDTYKNIYVLDKGTSSGIGKDNILVNEYNDRIKVIYSSFDYSIAKNIYGNAKIGDSFVKHSTTDSVKQIQKPKVLFFNDFMNDKLYTMFAGALGSDAKFSLMTMDDSYNLMKRVLPKLNRNFDSETLEARDMPDFFLKLYMSKPAYARYKTNVSYIENDKLGLIACGVIFDRSGKVVYSTCAKEEQDKEIKNGYRLDEFSNSEMITKNVFVTLAETIQKDIEFQEMEFKINKIDDQFIYITDSNGFLNKNNKLTVFKTVKPEKLGREFLVPTWEYKVLTREGDTVVCKPVSSYIKDINPPKKSDVAKMSVIASSSNKANMYNYVSDEPEMEGNTITLNPRIFNGIAFASISSKMSSPISMPSKDFEKYLDNMSEKGFARDVDVAENTGDLKIGAKYKIVQKSEKFKNNGKIIDRQYEVTVSVIGKKGDNVIKQCSAKKTILITVPKYKNEDITQYEMLKTIYLLIQQLAVKF